MRRWLLCAALAGAVSMGSVATAYALRIAPPPPGPARAAQADGIFLGRVVAHEPKDIQISPAPGADNKVAFRVAVVNVSEIIKGEKGTKSVRVAFMPPPNGDGPIKIRPRPGMGGPQLAMGTEGMFFLAKHHSEKDLYVVRNFYDVVAKGENDPNFDKEVKDVKHVMKLLENPMESLKSKNADDRFQTAALLIAKYRNPVNGGGKTEAIPAEESKLILAALLDGKWNAQGGRFGEQDAWQIFNNLGLTEKDNWKVPQNARNITDFHDAAKEWLKKNADSYRIQKFLPGTGNNPGPGGRPGPGGIRPPIQIQPVPAPGGIQIQPLPPAGGVQIQPGVIRIQPVPLPAPLPPARD